MTFGRPRGNIGVISALNELTSFREYLGRNVANFMIDEHATVPILMEAHHAPVGEHLTLFLSNCMHRLMYVANEMVDEFQRPEPLHVVRSFIPQDLRILPNCPHGAIPIPAVSWFIESLGSQRRSHAVNR